MTTALAVAVTGFLEGARMHCEVFTTHVAQSPDVVWAFLSDLRNDSKWRHQIESVEVVSGTPGDAPTTYREYVRWEGMRREVDLTVSDARCCSRLVVRSDGPGYESESRWAFDPGADGTIVTLTFSLQTSGTMQIAEEVLWRVIRRWLIRDLPLLEGHLASVPSSSSGTESGALGAAG